MDHNLLKMKDVCLESVSKGRLPNGKAFTMAVEDAHDYLSHILTDMTQINRECNEFYHKLKEDLDGLVR